MLGLHWTVNGDAPAAVPISVPLSKNCTDVIDEPAVGLAFTVTEMVEGEIAEAMVDPLVGVTKEIVGVARAAVAANNIATHAVTNDPRKAEPPGCRRGAPTPLRFTGQYQGFFAFGT